MFANYLIGLREGLEAGLIVGILLAYAAKIGRPDVRARLWWGVGIAVGVTLALSALLSWGPYALSEEAHELLAGVLSLVAVALVSWMIFWMGRHGAELAGELRGKLAAAAAGSGLGIVLVALVSVLREGIETALFVWATIRAQTDGGLAALGAVLGIASAIALSWLIYRGLVRIHLGRFFAWTGALLILLAAGVLSYAIGELAEVGVLPETPVAFDLSGVLPLESPLGAVLGGVFGYSPEPSWLQLAVWAVYLLVVGGLFLRQLRTRRAAVARPEAARLG